MSDDAASPPEPPEPDELDVLAATLGLTREQAGALLDACRWADQASAVRTFGYPKDNVMPPPMAQRLADARWVDDALSVAEEDATTESEAAIDALRRHLQGLAGG